MSAEKVIRPAETARLLQISIANKGRHSVHREATATAAYHFGLFADGRMSAAEAAELYTACRAGAGRVGSDRPQIYRLPAPTA